MDGNAPMEVAQVASPDDVFRIVSQLPRHAQRFTSCFTQRCLKMGIQFRKKIQEESIKTGAGAIQP